MANVKKKDSVNAEKKEEKKILKQGRPTHFNEEISKEICGKIATSSSGLKRLCRENPHWPPPSTIYEWMIKHQTFADSYANAKRAQIQVLIDEMVEISDDSSKDEDVNFHGEVIANKEFISRSRVRIDTRKWLAAKLIPRLYGDKIIQEVTGKDGGPLQLSNLDLSKLTSEQLVQLESLVSIARADQSGESKA